MNPDTNKSRRHAASRAFEPPLPLPPFAPASRAAGFKPLSTSELHPEDIAAAEEGVLEMVPLTQENSLDDSNDEAVVATRGVTVERDAAEAGQERAFPPSKDCGRRLEDDLADVCERLCSGSHGEPDEERLLSTRRRARSSSETRLETGGEGGGSRSRQHTGALSDERLARSEHRKTFNASTGEGRGEKSACWGECLVPMKLLTNRRVRGILFVYAVQSVRSRFVLCVATAFFVHRPFLACFNRQHRPASWLHLPRYVEAFPRTSARISWHSQ